jgi:photosystem II stability/assembly factor-like uncharacterized protein
MRVSLVVCVATLSSPLWAAWDAIGPFGGSAAVIHVDRHHRGTVLAATSNAQLFRSEDDGDSWRAIPFPAQLRATLHAFVLDPQNPGVYLVGLSSDIPEYSGILRSADSGLTWQRIPEADLKAVWSIAIWPRDSRVLAAGTEDGVFLTRNAGETWTRASPRENRGLRPVVSLAFDPTDSKVLYAGTPHLPWKTVDGGASWNSIHTGMLDDSDVFSIQVDASQPVRLFASACSGIYRSSNAGEKWTKLIRAQGASYRTYQITQDPAQPNIVFAGTTSGLEKSVDGGTTWRKLSTQSTRSIAFDPVRPGRIYVATDEEGLFRSDNLGESLHAINRGFCNRRLGSLAASGKVLYVNSIQNSTSGPILRMSDSEQTWAVVPSVAKLIRKQVVRIVSANSERLYIVTTSSLVVSADAGRSWREISAPSTSPLTDLLVPSADGHKLLVGTENGVFQTENAGETWKPEQLLDVKFGAPPLLTPAGPRTAVATAATPMLVSSSDGVGYQTTKHPGNGYEIYGIVATDHNGLLAATSRGLMRSDEVEKAWQPVLGILEGSTVTAICKHPTRAGVIFASKFGVIFVSKDDGHSWASLTSADDGTEVITELLVVPDIPGRLFALTRSRGIYSISLANTE